jgi:tRNA(Arg) A34 adenosine deaminase TadA
LATPEDFMRRAIEIAREKMLSDGAAPFGCVIVKDGEIVGEGVNSVVAKCDPTSHGEVEAIRDAGQKLGTWDLSGCELYTSCEPCELCVAAMFWAKIDRMYYAATLADCEQIGFDLSKLRDLVRNDLPRRPMRAEQILHPEARAVIDEWTTQPSFSTFQ